jgi:hypothetical protein
VGSWSEDIGVDGVVGDFRAMIPAIAFGIGLVFGFTFDTTGPRVRKETPVATPKPAVTKEHVAATDGEQVETTDEVGDDRRVHIGNGAQEAPAQEPEPAPRTREPTRS